MSIYAKDTDPAFQAAGAKLGLEIWCVENLKLVSVPKSSHGRFYSGSAYVILNTVLPKSGLPQHDIHYWLGHDTNKVDSALASDKALELDAALGSCTVQYRELQGQETGKFLSYFKPCIIPIEGVYTSQKEHLNGETYKVSLLACKGDHVVHVKEVPFSRSSLNHSDVFILDTASKIFLFSGCNSSIQERAKALEVVQYIKENKHRANCEVATVEDGKFVGDPEVGEFWSLFGGYAPIPQDPPSSVQKQPDTPFVKLSWISTQGKLHPCQTDSLSKEMLETDKCYMVDCDSEIFVWMGKHCSVTERKTSISAAEDFLRNQGRSAGTHSTFITEGLEPAKFRSYFNNWPQTVETKLYEEGRGKVAAMFKQQGYEVKELPDEEDIQPFIDSRGTLKVWRVDCEKLSLLPASEERKIFSGDCYVVQYTYLGNERSENLFYAWLGCGSVMEDRRDAISHLNAIVDSTRGNPVLAQVMEKKESSQFFSIFQTLIIFKGGMSTRYKKFIAEKGIGDETYDESKTALFRVQGTSPNNMQAIQVDPVSGSLNSSYCYILQTGTSAFTWIGNLSSTRDHDLLDRMLELIIPTWQAISVREGSESDIFWNALGGKADYARAKEIKGYIEDPHLFMLSTTEGDFKVKEIYNFTQDDLTTEDVLVLDCHTEIHVWIGCHSNIRSKQQALTLGLKFLETDVLVEGLSLETPIYVISEGHEPPFFTHFFEWDSSKSNMLGNSFERKLAILKGKLQQLEAPKRNSWKAYSRETTPDGLRSKSMSSNGQRSVSPASGVSVSSVTSSNNYMLFSSTPINRKIFTGSSPNGSPDVSFASAGSPAAEAKLPATGGAQADGNEPSEAGTNLLIYPYERLKVISKDPIAGIDITKREAYLADEEFQAQFAMTKRDFYKLAKWKQNKLKMALHLF
ncbi:PREDICTED: villin-1 [Prunus mume]|uniref:Villin-1 n=1 Tax=Prunus mume TaxID=102107 RepID=A0ABM0N7K8_PRUMU|nr:PREDICTED: villin-1 [Prunus mume]XP_016650638.1 PREDICTED: villin-1 [Prunus mume]